jgi:hypothetical protein
MDSRELPETFRWNSAGIQSCSLEPGQQAEASLAWASVTASAKRRQRRCRTMLLSPEISLVVVLAVSCTGDRAVASQWPDVNGAAGVAGTWWASTGVPQGSNPRGQSPGPPGRAVAASRLKCATSKLAPGACNASCYPRSSTVELTESRLRRPGGLGGISRLR